MIRTRKHAPAALLALLAATPLAAQDGGLYPDPASPDASFLRVIAPESESAIIDGRKVSISEAGVSPYVEVSPGTVSLSAGEMEAEVEVGANTHYTRAGDRLIEDAMRDSPAQADLLLYNLTDMESFDLYAVEAETAALSDIAPGEHDGVGLKAPLTLTFDVRQDGETLAALEPVDLRRGTATTVILSGTPGDLVAAAAASTYAE